MTVATPPPKSPQRKPKAKGQDSVTSLELRDLPLSEIDRRTLEYEEPLKERARYLANYCREKCDGNWRVLASLVNDEVRPSYQGQILSYKHNTLSQMCLHGYFNPDTGRTRVPKDKFVEMVDAVRRYELRMQYHGKVAHLATSRWHLMEDYILRKAALDAVCRFGVMAGGTGVEKTHNQRHFSLVHNHGRTMHFETPADGSLASLRRKMARGCNLKTTATGSYLDDLIREELHRQFGKIILMDNAQRLFRRSTRKVDRSGGNQLLFEWILEMQEETGCTIIYSWTWDDTGLILNGDQKLFFEQIVGRTGGLDEVLNIPRHPTPEDFLLYAGAFQAPTDRDSLKIYREWEGSIGALRILMNRLQRCRRIATQQGHDAIPADLIYQLHEEVTAA